MIYGTVDDNNTVYYLNEVFIRFTSTWITKNLSMKIIIYQKQGEKEWLNASKKLSMHIWSHDNCMYISIPLSSLPHRKIILHYYQRNIYRKYTNYKAFNSEYQQFDIYMYVYIYVYVYVCTCNL